MSSSGVLPALVYRREDETGESPFFPSLDQLGLCIGDARLCSEAMETDSFFWQLFKQLPQTLFELLGLPTAQARGYRFDSVEVKKSFRIDGLFLPRKPGPPLYVVEVQFQRVPSFYANLFAKVFCYLEENDPGQDWRAVAIFPGRRIEPMQRGPYEDLLQSPRVHRIYLDELPPVADPPVGLGILQLVSAPVAEAKSLVTRLLQKARRDLASSGLAAQVVQLVEELLLRRFSMLTREEVRAMFGLEDLRKTRVWQEAHEEGREEGLSQGREQGQALTKKAIIGKMLAKGMTVKQIAALLDMSAQEVRRLAGGR
jgi:predicted transposase/invertase (TIGR01784 family)